ncbi:MAG: flippase activity-associated protein Agl23 [Opitutales bacterium]|jgi:uncharacterized protein (TIGR03663 family)
MGAWRQELIASISVAIVIVAGLLRFSGLELRPMHVDEATGARILASRMETGEYAFDPRHFHGPFLGQTIEPVARLFGQTTWESLSATLLRSQTAIAGCLLVLLPLLWRSWMGIRGALLSGALLATSPLLVYYNRMYIHESLLALMCLACLTFILQWLQSRRTRWACLAGAFAGMAFATKETFVITVLSWLAAGLLVGWAAAIDELRSTWKQRGTGFLLGIGVAVVTTVLLYTDCFRHPQGALDAVKTLFVYETGFGHDHPWFFYLELLLLPKWRLSILWGEGLVLVLALMALAGLLVKGSASLDPVRRRILSFLAVAALGQLAIYSCIGYKTPWLMMVPWAHFLIMAGFICTGVFGRSLVLGAASLTVILAGWQSVAATGRLANDARNPYAYAPTTRDVMGLRAWLSDLEAMVHPDRMEPLAVVGTGYWPLPWYLRGLGATGYWARVPDGAEQMPVVIVMPGEFESAEATLGSTHAAFPRSLRDNTPILLFLRNDLWERWMDTEPVE